MYFVTFNCELQIFPRTLGIIEVCFRADLLQKKKKIYLLLSVTWKHHQVRTTLKYIPHLRCTDKCVLTNSRVVFSTSIQHHRWEREAFILPPSAWQGSFLVHLYMKSLSFGVPTSCLFLLLGMLLGQDLSVSFCTPCSMQPSKEKLGFSSVQKNSEQKPSLVLDYHPGFFLSHCFRYS